MGAYSLTDSDVKTILFTLEIHPSLGVEDTEVQAEINYQLCRSAGTKLISGRASELTPNEFRIIYASLLGGRLINQGELEVDAETKKQCLDYLFSINKLLSVFEKEFS
ncbi:hypothetical protein J6TS7_56250 [Paenibacillus dendritiformis]|uniref:hypothetical protein n=1 Tax=Paenibacillus TaxID=44249 RepID=UPI001B1EECF7|nr:hypothetical protein [Paenibacillus dendritiformis]GIO82015.1 hypothetical protein J6TS7_56250 [Paenibacillus dendritiformis]